MSAGYEITSGQIYELERLTHGFQPASDPAIVDGFAEYWPAYVMASNIAVNTTRLSQFIAQVAIETDHFKTLREYHDGSNYEGREDLGNVHPGDGVRFPGRGYLQITGRANYGWIGDMIGVDLLAAPELLEQPRYALMASAAYWHARVSIPSADSNHKIDVANVTSAVQGTAADRLMANGELAHFDERLAHFMKTGVIWPHARPPADTTPTVWPPADLAPVEPAPPPAPDTGARVAQLGAEIEERAREIQRLAAPA